MIPLIAIEIKTSKESEVIPGELVRNLRRQGYQMLNAGKKVTGEKIYYLTSGKPGISPWSAVINKQESELSLYELLLRVYLRILLTEKYCTDMEGINSFKTTAHSCQNDQLTAIIHKALWKNYIQSIVIKVEEQ